MMLLWNTENIIGSQKIFTTKSLQIVTLLSSSVLAKYDAYTRMQFGLMIIMCEKLESFDLGLIGMIMVAINLIISIWTQIDCLKEIR